jgi:glucose-1-phosphate thymidylyltransferase
MIGVVLARGAGRRMRAHGESADLTPAQAAAASAGRKAMMPIGAGDAARPFLDYVLAALADAGCDRICLVIAPDQDEVRQRYLSDVRPTRFALTCAEQPDASGTAHAVLAAEAAVDGAPFLVVNADNLYPVAALADLVVLEGPGLLSFSRVDLVASSHIPPERIAAFASIDVDEAGWLRGIVEKPEPAALGTHGADMRVSMNAWRFDRRIFDACREVGPSARGEYELPEAVALALTRHVPFRAVPARGPVLDLSHRRDIPGVSARLAGRVPKL